jgi:anti-sigma factor RsiW
MNCRYVQSRLSCYIDGELSGREMILIRRHLDFCRSCDSELESLRATKQLLGSLGVPAVRPDFEERLVQGVLGCEKERIPLLERLRSCARGDWLAWGVGVAGLAAAVVIALTPERGDLFTRGYGVSAEGMHGAAAYPPDPDLNEYFKDHNERNPDYPYQIYPGAAVAPVDFQVVGD